MQAAARSNPGLTENVRFWPKADVPSGGHSCAGGKVHSPPRAGIPRSARLAPGKVRLYIGLLARPGRPNIESYQGG